MHLIIGIFLVFLFILLFIGLSIINTILRLFGFGRKATRNPGTYRKRAPRQHTDPPPAPKKKKVFDNNEGEYVDYEELE